jgi:hypothetical protein
MLLVANPPGDDETALLQPGQLALGGPGTGSEA